MIDLRIRLSGAQKASNRLLCGLNNRTQKALNPKRISQPSYWK